MLKLLLLFKRVHHDSVEACPLQVSNPATRVIAV